MEIELDSLRSMNNRRFFKIETSAKDSYFVRIADDKISPSIFLSEIFKNIKNSTSFNARYTSKILPIESTFVANEFFLTKALKKN